MISGNTLSVPPALHGGVMLMAQGASQGTYSAAIGDDLSLVHTHDVHVQRTQVNVESVTRTADNSYVANNETTGQALDRLRMRAGLSMRALAQAAGYSHASGVQRYLEADFEKRLSLDVAEKFVTAMVGKGQPPIHQDEILRLTGLSGDANALPFRMEGADERRMNRDVPVYGTALGADEIVDGEAIEQIMLNSADVIGYLRRPVLLDGRADIYGLYVQGSSMAPRHRDGATLFVESKRQPSVGEDVVIYLRVPDEHDGERPSSVLIKTLRRKTAAYVELEQYSPALTFQIPRERIAMMHRVVPWDELVA